MAGTVHDTISDVLEILRMHLQKALDELQPFPSNQDEDSVILSHIASKNNNGSSEESTTQNNRIVITLIKTEEEFALKNQPNHRRNPVTNNIEYVNPPVFLNLYLLITPKHSEYSTALTFLSRIIAVFQKQRVFNENNTQVDSDTSSIDHFEFNLSMLSPSFEQLNHMWSILGGQHLPSVLYKLQLVRIEYVPDEAREGNPIREIVVNEQLF